jgi:flagellar assembly factor FliW
MKIDTSRFGTIEVAEENAIAVPNGIPGFPNMRRVMLMAAGAAPGQKTPEVDHSLFWLQDLDDGDLAFMAVVPWAVFPEYDLDFDATSLDIIDDDDVRILNLVTVRRVDGAAQLSANLRAPLVVDTRQHRMHQVIMHDMQLPVSAMFANKSTADVA